MIPSASEILPESMNPPKKLAVFAQTATHYSKQVLKVY